MVTTTAPPLVAPVPADAAVVPLPRPEPRPSTPPLGLAAAPADRARGELDAAHREALADRIHALVVDAAHWSRCDTPPQRAHRAQVLAARGRLADIEHALRSGIPVRLRGEPLVARLVSDDAVGAYCHGRVRALHDDADAACAALGVVTTFH